MEVDCAYRIEERAARARRRRPVFVIGIFVSDSAMGDEMK
jgi:hypothetical protein